MSAIKDTITVFSGDFAVGLSALALNVVLSRLLGVTEFGLFATVMSVLLVAGSIADFGLGTSLVRFISLHGKSDYEISSALTVVAFRFIVATGALVSLAVFFGAGSLAGFLFKKPALAVLIKVVSVGIFGTALTAATLSILQSRQSFGRYTLVNSLTAAGRIVMIASLIAMNLLNLPSAVFVFSIVPIMTFSFGFIMVRPFIRGVNSGKKLPSKIFTDFLHFGKWVILSLVLVSLMSRIDIFLLAHFRSGRAVGLYAAALQLSMVVYILVGSVIRVILPKVSGLTHKRQYIDFIRKALKFSLVGCLVLSPLLLFSREIVLTVYGRQYASSVDQFRLLFFTFLLIPLFQPVTMIVYALGKPFIMTFTHLSQFVFSVVSNLVLIPIYGGYGAAITLFIINAAATVFLITYIVVTVNRGRDVILKEELRFNV